MQPLTKKNNFIYLCSGLILLLLIGSLVEYFPGDTGQRFVQAATIVVLLFAALGERANRTRAGISLTVMVIMIVVVLLGSVLDLAGLGILHLVLLLSFFFWMTWLLISQVLFTGTIDGNKIIGAICVYILLGLIWALLYLLIAEIVPEAFNGMPHAPWVENFAAATYFSLVTITTLGYGDISPVLPLARFLVYMEAIVGVFYMAILVASLIGVRLSDRSVATGRDDFQR